MAKNGDFYGFNTSMELLKYHCQRCLLGKTSKKINNALKEAENIVPDEFESRYYYLCGVAPSMALEENFYLAFEESEGDSIEYSFNGIIVKIKNTKRVEFSADDINWDVEYSDEELYNSATTGNLPTK